MEREGKAEDVYNILIVDDDPIVAEGIAMGVAEPGRHTFVCHDLDSAAMQVELGRVDVVVADVCFGGQFSYEGLRFVDLVKKSSPETQVILMTGIGTDGLEREAIRRGAAGFLRKPFPISALEALLRQEPWFIQSSSITHVPNLEHLLEEDLIRMEFQPVVTLLDRAPVGFEALARLDTDSFLRSPEKLFAYASRAGRLMELETYCLRAAIGSGASLANDALLFLNVHPHSLESPAIVRALSRAAEEADVPLGQLVLEITEQGAIRTSETFVQIEALRGLGVQFAFDDVGVAFSHLPYIDRIGPQWMKVSQTFGTDFEQNPTKVKIIDNLVMLADSFGARLVLEGVEQEATVQAAIGLGIRYAQGWHFGHQDSECGAFSEPAPLKNP